MVLNCKSHSSIQVASVGKGGGKAGLKRKLTGPPRLLLGKSKAKSDLEISEESPRMSTKGHNSDHRGTMATQKPTIQEERSPGCISENQKKPVEAEVKQTTPENLFETQSEYSGNKSVGKAKHSDAQSDPKKQPMKRVWKQFFPSSLNCIRRRKRLSKMSAMEDFSYHNTQSEKFECDAELAVSDTLPPEQPQNAQTNNNHGCRTVKRRAPFPFGLRWNIAKQLKAPSHHKKTKRLSDQEMHFEFVDSLRPDLFLRKRIGCFLKHGPKKTSAIFVDQLERNHEYLDEETIVLSNRHAGGICEKMPPNIQEENHSDGNIEVSILQSETLTVNVEVSVLGEACREQKETDTEVVGSAELVIASGQTEKEVPPGSAEAYDGSGTMANPTESSRHAELVKTDLLMKETTSKNLSVQGASASNLSPDDTKESQDNFSGQDLRLFVDDSPKSLYELFKDTVGHYGEVVEETIPQSGGTDEDRLRENLALNNVKFDGLLLCCDVTNTGIENGSEVSPEDNPSLHDKVLGRQCSDAFLVQTACSLVQAAMKAALDQLTKELKIKSGRIHTEYHEFQDDT